MLFMHLCHDVILRPVTWDVRLLSEAVRCLWRLRTSCVAEIAGAPFYCVHVQLT